MPQAKAGPRPRDTGLSRNRPVDPARTALLIIDVQNLTYNPGQRISHPEFYERARDVVIPALRHLVHDCRLQGVEVVYTVIENATEDGRDRSLDYKLSNVFVARGSAEAHVIDALRPARDELVIPKTSSSLFNSTNIEYLLRNIGITDLVVTGFMTDQCVDHTIRDAADRGFFVTCLTDACMAGTQARHEGALAGLGSYCRLLRAAEWLALQRARDSAD
ncbi:cysteine hydrolase family protein [Zavarzinia sp. CC-PAN008]|uniref:cysteine hydrolase family protein n=1 Tax=Zavarzinia sp. CC-PAN008 TaxID=3243332 RepID=UPI003F74505B